MDEGNSIIPTLELKMLFDMCIDSGDFSDGNLNKDQVDLLRKLAVQFEMDLMWATPHNFRTNYTHEYVEETTIIFAGAERRTLVHYRCKWCREGKGHKLHVTEGKSDGSQ